jgi:hypothetical protein
MRLDENTTGHVHREPGKFRVPDPRDQDFLHDIRNSGEMTRQLRTGIILGYLCTPCLVYLTFLL